MSDEVIASDPALDVPAGLELAEPEQDAAAGYRDLGRHDAPRRLHWRPTNRRTFQWAFVNLVWWFWIGLVVAAFFYLGLPGAIATACAFAAVGLLLVHTWLVEAFNATTVEIVAGELRVHAGPVPAGRTTRLATADIRELHVVTSPRSGQHASDVVARLASGERVVLVRGLPEIAQARWLAATLYAWLGLGRQSDRRIRIAADEPEEPVAESEAEDDARRARL